MSSMFLQQAVGGAVRRAAGRWAALAPSFGSAAARMLIGIAAAALPAAASAATPPQIHLFTEAVAAQPSASLTFGFTLTGATTASDSITVTGPAQVESSQSAAGIFGSVAVQATLQESTVAPGWASALAAATLCTDKNAPSDGNASSTANLAVVSLDTVTLPASVMKDGAVIKCVLSNSRAQIFLKKQITGSAPDGGLFNLAITGGNAGPGSNPVFNVGSGGTTSGIGVDMGSSVTLTETAGTGTSLSNYVSGLKCRDFGGVLYAQGVSGSGGTFSVTAPAASSQGNAQSLICTLTNTALPSVIVAKQTVGKTGTFNFTLSGLSNFTDVLSTTSAAKVTSAAVNVGTVGTAASIVETTASAAGYAVSTRCIDANSGITGNTAAITSNTSTATIPAANMVTRAAYTCTFTNTKLTSIFTSKTASANPLLPAVVGQFYTVGVTVAYAPTTAPILLRDTLPGGITLDGAPTVVSGTATLTGCPISGSNTTGCSLAAGIAVGALSIRIPISIATAAIGPGGGTNSVNLSGGGDSSCTVTAGEACDGTTPTTAVGSPAPTLQIVKNVTSGAGSNLFHFDFVGLSAATDNIAVTGVGQGSGAIGITGTAGQTASVTETSPSGWPWVPVSASCVDSNTAVSGNPTGPLGMLVQNVLTLPASRMVNGAKFTCTFVNAFSFNVTGRVFTDNGVGSGTPNNGIVDGSEAGHDGAVVNLTDCVSATPFATVLSNPDGYYVLPVAMATVTGARLCVDKADQTAHTATGASIGGTALTLGAALATGGTSYTYSRPPGTARIAFTWNGTGHYGLNFADVPPASFVAGGTHSGQPGNTISFAHMFTAQTGGTVVFSVGAAVGRPALDGWSQWIIADAGCTGVPQPGATMLYPGNTSTSMIAGQSLCIIVQEFIPANAPGTYTNEATVQAGFSLSNAVPPIVMVTSLLDAFALGGSAIDLKKAVRNVTTGGAFGIRDQANSGETLEYRITYTNNGSSPVSSLSVADFTPAYTTFVGVVDANTAAQITCQKQTPANPAPGPTVPCALTQTPGGTGAVTLQFLGSILPGGSGTMLLQVKVN